MRPGRAVADFDSASGMLRALGRFLDGRDIPLIGQGPAAAEPWAAAWLASATRLPRRAQQSLYAWSGWSEALRPDQLLRVDSDGLARWAADHYPRRRVPAVLLGSSNGAGVHLAAALGAPWLPQTLFLPVRRNVPPDDGPADIAALQKVAREFLDANPDLVLHHMHDANQDRLMLRYMTYFRVKWRTLPDAYVSFLDEVLEPGGTVILLDCTLRWPTTTVGERHLFQQGAVGGIPAQEYLEGSDRVSAFLARHGSRWRRWGQPEPDGESPEAEWGFEPALAAPVMDLARRRGWRVRQLRYPHPEDLSPFVADLHRWWYARQGRPTDRLLVESFLLLEPWWTLRTASVPLWLAFGVQGSLRRLTTYLDTVEEAGQPFDELRLTLFSHGVESVGLAGAEEWARQLRRGRKLGVFVGVDPQAYPRDFASVARFHRDLSKVRDVVAMPAPLTLAELDTFLRERTSGGPVELIDDVDVP